MFVKALPVKGDRLRSHNKRKYYPGEVYEVDRELGAELLALGHVEVYEPPKPVSKPVFKPRRYARS